MQRGAAARVCVPFLTLQSEVAMCRRFAGVGLFALLASPVFGQSPATPARFEIADVHVSAPRMNPGAGVRPGAVRNGVYEIANGTMLDLIRIAYTVEADKVLGGP